MGRDRLFREEEYSFADCCVFGRVREDWGGFSNMSNEYPVTVNGIAMRNTEALYQACRYPHDTELQREIINQRSGYASKLISKPHRKNETRPDWQEVMVDIMRWCLAVKLAQNFEQFGKLLTDTGLKPIVEYSSKDKFWGAVLNNRSRFEGKNVLGKLLMELRDHYVNGCSETRQAMKFVPPLDLPDFLLYGETILAVGEFLEI